MLRFNVDYFAIEFQDISSEELYYWEDVIRVGYYVHREWGYDGRPKDSVYLIVQHECGEYLKIPSTSDDWDLFDRNMDKYLPVKHKDRKKLLKNPPVDSLIDLYVRGK